MAELAPDAMDRARATLSSAGSVRSVGPGVTVGVAAALARFLLPSPCLGCGALDPPLDMSLGLCPACRARLREVGRRRCVRCLRPLAGGVGPMPTCAPCARRRGGPDRLLAGWLYAPPLDAVLLALKFGGQSFLGRHLATALAARLAHQLAGVDLVVPVPLHWRRQVSRGYNQAAEIARPLARRLGRPYRSVLARRRSTARQAELPREARGANLRGAFVVRRPTAARGRVCLLVDDVVTTGATLAAAAAALRRAGAVTVLAVAAARTPEPDEGLGPLLGPE